MYNHIFNIDFYRFVAMLLPTAWRRSRMIHWLQCLISPAVDLYNQFLQYRDAKIYEIEHTSQVFSIEMVLNDSFDQIQRRIRIEDGVYTFPVYFYDRLDDLPVRFNDRSANSPQRFFDRSNLGLFDVDFTVVLPLGLNLSNAEMIRLKSTVDLYKLPDKTYSVTYE
ncbi:MAG: hypothetical protein AAF717_00410 [Bacteroidota bacterium]